MNKDKKIESLKESSDIYIEVDNDDCADKCLKLYNSKEEVARMDRTSLYFNLDDKYKEKYINDLKDMDNIYAYYFRQINDKKIKMKILQFLIENDKVNDQNIHLYSIEFKEEQEVLCYMFEILFRKSKKIDYPYLDLNYLNEEKRFELLKGFLKNKNVKIESYIMLKLIESFSNSTYKKELSYDYFKHDSFSKSEREAENITKKLMEISFEGEENEVVNFIRDNEVNKNLNIELILRKLPSEKIINYFNANGIHVDVNKILDLLPDGNVWVDLYNYFERIPGGKKYINEGFLRKGVHYCEKNTFNQIIRKQVLMDETKSVKSRIDMIRSLYASVDDKLYGIELLIDYFGTDIDLSLNNETSEIYKKFDMNQFPKIKEYINKNFNIINNENLNKFFDRFGNFGIAYLYEKNIINLINMESAKFDKIMSLIGYNTTNLDNGVVNTVINSLLQREFRLEENDYNIFSKFERLMVDKNEYTLTEVKKLLNKIDETINVYSIISKEEIDTNKLFEGDCEEIDLLHKLTNSYIARKREIYIANNLEKTKRELIADKYYDKAYIKNYFFKLNDEKTIENFLRFNKYRILDKLSDKEKELLGYKDVNKLSEIIRFKKNPLNVNPSKELISNLKALENIMNIYYNERLLKLDKEPIDAKYDYHIIDVTDQQLLGILANTNMEHIDEYLLNNDKVYNKLLELFIKYKIPGWGSTFDKLGANLDVNVECSVTSGLINYFDKILKMYNELSKNNQTLTALLDITNAYTCGPKKYINLLNKENYNFIASNPGPNSSVKLRDERIKEIPYHINNMYSRDSVTIPSGEMTLDLDEYKKILISIADIYDPIALTYGERTGACLRIQGAYGDLFEYCLKDKNGFHIKFSNPETGEFISRVSGIRNGNTVFLNELRDSVNENYSSEELVKALNMVAKFLVESTKNDQHPIENVVVSNDFSMRNESTEDLNLNILEAFNGLSFNIYSDGHILYTSNAENHKKLMPYKFGDEYVSEYKPYNKKVSVGGRNKAQEFANRVHMINEIMKGKSIDEIEILEINDVEKCIYGHGWIVYVDSMNYVHELVIDKFKNDRDLRKLIEESKEKHFGGVKHEASR